MFSLSRSIVLSLLFASLCVAPLASINAQESRDRRASSPSEDERRLWPTPTNTIVSAPGANDLARLAAEPVMRIALSTDAGAATISTAAHLLKASELDSTPPQPLDATRVRVESRLLSSPKQTANPSFDLSIARSLSREEADRLVNTVKELTGDNAHAVADGDKWQVVISKQSSEDADAASAKLEEAGFEVTLVNHDRATQPSSVANQPNSKSSAPYSNVSRVRLTSRAGTERRELTAFARGAAPLFRSSAPVIFASNDEANSPVRFNDKPYRGRLEVFANPHGALTVVNVIGLEDYVRGVVPNELSYPALEALKAQAIAARTYAVRNRGQFSSEGFDLLPTTRSQVYRGLTSETALTSRAVDETRGVIATYNGEPINALYTSTCGGRTEDAENIFNQAVPYLRGRECAFESKTEFAPFMIKSSRELFQIRDEKDLAFARDAAVLDVNGFALPTDKVSSGWLSSHISEADAGEWLNAAARLAHNLSFKPPDDPAKPPAFSTALVAAVYGESRADTLLNSADADYLLGFRDGAEVPTANRADVAMLIREGALSLFADATLHPKEAMSKARALHAIARLLEKRNLLSLQKGTSRPASGGLMILKSNKGKDTPVNVSHEVFLFREFGDSLFQMKSLALVGGEPVVYHANAKGEVDYLEVRPANNGAAADRFSSLSNWSAEISLGAVQLRLGRSVRGVGSITDLRVAKRGSSRRVIDLEVVGTEGVGHITGGRIRSALGLKEQLFVIDRVYNDSNRVAGFVFTGRGWGHGVGMCQFGAYGLAKQGLTVEQILKTYYTGIELTKLYN